MTILARIDRLLEDEAQKCIDVYETDQFCTIWDALSPHQGWSMGLGWDDDVLPKIEAILLVEELPDGMDTLLFGLYVQAIKDKLKAAGREDADDSDDPH